MGQRVLLLMADLANIEDVTTLTSRANEGLGQLDALINNASCFERDTVDGILPTGISAKTTMRLSPASWSAHIDVNLRAPTFLMRDFAAQAENGGVIINMLDQRVWRLTPDFISYTVSKSGLWTLTQSFAQALAPHGIRVNAIGPGPTLASARQSAEGFARQAAHVPLGHGASPSDIVDAARYILSASAMTGQMLALDGGQHIAWQTPDICREE